MNRSIAFAATSLSAILLVAATLATPASAQERFRNIDIAKKKFPTLTTITPDVAGQGGEVQVPLKGGINPNILLSTVPDDRPEIDTPDTEASPEAPVKRKNNRISTVNDDRPPADTNIEGASSETTVLPKFTVPETPDGASPSNEEEFSSIPDDRPELGTPVQVASPPVEEETQVVDEAPPPPKKQQPKVLQTPDEEEELAEPKPLLTPKKPVDAANSDDFDEEEDADVATTKTEEEPTAETAETADEEATPTYNKKFRMRYSPSLRRYVQVTDEDFADEAPEIEDHGYEAPTYRRSYSHGYGQRRNYNYLPSCEN